MLDQPLEARAGNVWFTVAQKHVETFAGFPRGHDKLGNHGMKKFLSLTQRTRLPQGASENKADTKTPAPLDPSSSRKGGSDLSINQAEWLIARGSFPNDQERV